MEVLKQGAEAIVYSDMLDGENVLVKERVKKSYRIEQIDSKLRLNRTRQELKLMREARGHGVLTPRIISSDEKSCRIVMERIDGNLVKDFLNVSKEFEKACNEIGKNIGKLHDVGIIHGDLTTSNMIMKDGNVYLIDFGLGYFSNRVEDMATDISVFLEALRATHSRIHGKCWKAFVRGYTSKNARAKDVMVRVGEIESRGRYKK